MREAERLFKLPIAKVTGSWMVYTGTFNLIKMPRDSKNIGSVLFSITDAVVVIILKPNS